MVVSLAGDLLYWVALVAFLAGGTTTGDGATWVAVALIVRLVPYVVIGPIGGAIADRFDRRKLLVGIDLSRAIVFLLLALVIAVDGPRAAAVALVGLAAIGGTIYRPALVAATPFLVTEDDLGAANAAEASLVQLSLFVGPALGAALVVVMDPALVVTINAATFIASASLVMRIGHVGGGKRAGSATALADAASTGLVAETVEGFRIVARDRGVTALVTLITTVLFMFGAEQVLFVLVARDRLDLGAEGVGVFMAAAGLGGLVLAPFTGRLASSSRIGWWAGGAGSISGGALLLLAFVDTRTPALLLAAVDGAGAIIFEVTVITLLQRAVAEDALGRVFSVQDAVSAVGEVVGSLLAPILATAVGLGFALGAIGLAGVVISALTIPVIVALAARLEARRLALRGTTEWLATIEELAALEPGARERLARSSDELRVPAGTTVVQEGESPDDLYVVRAGRLTVSSSSAALPIPDLGAGDLFGEIGLLRGLPRTATVTTAADTELVRIDGGVFVDVVLGGTSLPDPLARGIGQRLRRTHPALDPTVGVHR